MSGPAEVFAPFDCWAGDVPEGFEANFLGVLTRAEFVGAPRPPARRVSTTYPYARSRDPHDLLDLDEDILEWIDVLESVMRAQGSYTMVELGAGYGRWLVNAAAALRVHSRLPGRFVGVEAEPTHFAWMQRHVVDNAISLDDVRLIRAAVAPSAGYVRFHVGDPAAWYGQAIDPNRPDPVAKRGLRSHLGRIASRLRGRSVVHVPAITLSELLRELGTVDLVDADIQDAEGAVFEKAREAVAEHVKRVHVGTHSEESEQRLREVFQGLGWTCVNDYRLQTVGHTPWGPISFQDGVQTWINPRLDPG